MKRAVPILLLALVSSLAFAGPALAGAKVVDVLVSERGFEPAKIQTKAGEALTLKLTRNTDQTCAKEIVFPSLKIKKALPLNQAVTLELPALAKGELRFGCGMDMMFKGVITAD